MPTNEALVERVRKALEADGAAADDVREQRMFGGVCFMLGGNMAVGVHGDDLMVRMAPADLEAALKKPHARPWDLFGMARPPKGWVLVGPDGTRTARALATWVALGASFARSLPVKSK